MNYSFMEFVFASSISRWHIRKLTDKGKKFGGGIDTAPLCGQKHDDGKLINGWDVRADINDRRHDDHTCLGCLEKYNELIDEEVRAEVEQDLHAAGIIEDPDMDGGLLG